MMVSMTTTQPLQQSRVESTESASAAELEAVAKAIAEAQLTPAQRVQVLEAAEHARCAGRTGNVAGAREVLSVAGDLDTPMAVSRVLRRIAPHLVTSSRVRR